ncbi:MAG: GDSL-type esterase/lipase family protein [Endomicrobiales bacterium]
MRHRQKIFLILLGIAGGFLLIEAGLRLAGSAFRSLQEHRNLQNLRSKSDIRVLCLGESTTARQYPRYLERALNEKSLQARFTVIDKGIPGVTTDDIVAHLRENIEKYRPDIVVTMMGVNDRSDRVPFPRRTGARFSLRNLAVYRLLLLARQHIFARRHPHRAPAAGEEYRDYVIGEIALARGETGKAEKIFGKLAASGTEDYRPYVLLGECYRRRGDYRQAEGMFRRAIEKNPSSGFLHVQLALLYSERKDAVRARQSLATAVRLGAREDDLYPCLEDMEGRKTALEALMGDSAEEFLRNRPLDAGLALNLGVRAMVKGEFARAEEMFGKAAQERPSDYRPFAHLALNFMKQKRFAEANGMFLKALSLAPLNDTLHGMRMRNAIAWGRQDLVEECAEKLKEIDLGYCSPQTLANYRAAAREVTGRGIPLVCMQYPLRGLEPLKRMLEGFEGVVYVENETVFREALKKAPYDEYFRDVFAGDFGHCTDKGNALLAENIAGVILRVASSGRGQ